MPANNSITFLGRVANDIKVTTIGTGQNAFNKVNFTIAVDRRLSKKEKQDKTQGIAVKGANFPPMEANGATADMISQYFSKGKPICVSAYYEDYSYVDNQTQQKKYGHKFIIESVNFVPSDATQGANGGNGGQNNHQQSQNQNTNNVGDYGDYQVSPEDMPF